MADVLGETGRAEARARFEAERLSRRQALRKFGFGAGMAALMALSADDLARLAAARLERVARDNQTARQIAEEFKNAGIAQAAMSPCAGCEDCPPYPKAFSCTPCSKRCDKNGNTQYLVLAFDCARFQNWEVAVDCCEQQKAYCVANCDAKCGTPKPNDPKDPVLTCREKCKGEHCTPRYLACKQKITSN
ncbi:MAG: hypothetical protein SFU56_21805 [Capsulimonadales bacterium]|nr:hypothetical protein [Capsulimonadales bacterium]